MTDPDTDRLELLDRIAERLPEIDLAEHTVEWHELPDGAQGLLVDGGGVDGGTGFTFANAGDDLHALGTLAPLAPGCIGCVVIRPDGHRYLAGVAPDPAAQQQPD